MSPDPLGRDPVGTAAGTPTVVLPGPALVPSDRDPATARLDVVVEPGDGFVGTVPAGARFRIVDLAGNQAVDTLLFDAADPANRYSAVDTIREQRSAYLTTGSRLLSVDLDLLATVVADTCGRHDTVGGACAQESNVVRYGMHTRHQHACRETFLRYGARVGIDARGLTHNINFFMNVPLTPDGGLDFADGLSAPGRYVELEAARDVIVLISNCPQLNNPCNGWNPTPVRLLRWDPGTGPGAATGTSAHAVPADGPAPVEGSTPADGYAPVDGATPVGGSVPAGVSG